MVHARRGNASMVMLVGITDGRLAAVVLDRELGLLDGGTRCVTSTWTLTPTTDPAPVIEAPASYIADRE